MSSAYEEWMKLFDSNVSEIWQSERKELQKASMLLWVLHKELKTIHETLESEVSSLRQELSKKDRLGRKRKFSPSKDVKKQSPRADNKENSIKALTEEGRSPKCNLTELESPDIFRNIDINSVPKQSNEVDSLYSTIIDLSLSDEDDYKRKIEDSPTLISKHRKDPRRYKTKIPSESDGRTEMNKSDDIAPVRTNLFRTPRPDLEMSVIDSTPDLNGKKTDSKLVKLQMKKKVHKKVKNATMTQFFPNSKRECDEGQDSDETYFEMNKTTSKMGITDLLNLINEDEAGENNSHDMEELDSTQEVDQFSKGAFFDDTCLEETSPKKKSKLVVIQPEPVVRGHARKNLNAFACVQCKNFYGNMKLPPEELQKKMDECSRHRYTYQPPEETIPGFWDMSIPPENEQEK